MTGPVVLIAAGGLARETLASLLSGDPRRAVLGFLDDDPALAGHELSGLPVLGSIDVAAKLNEAKFLICAGRGAVRRTIAARLAELGIGDERFTRAIHPSVHIPSGCTVGVGSIMLPGTVITADVTAGRHVVCMPHVTLTHDDVLADFATLAAGVSLGGGVHVGDAAYLGMNSTVRERCSVGADAVLGMGAALLDDQPAGTVWAGVPARPLDR